MQSYSPIIVAIIAASSGIVIGTLNTFLFELYKRYKDGTALAASFYGELSAYEENRDAVLLDFNFLIKSLETGGKLNIRMSEKERDYIFEKSVEKLGLLGPGIIQRVIRVYSTIRAFRIGFEVLSKNIGTMEVEEATSRLKNLQKLDFQIKEQTAILLTYLQIRSTAKFWKEIF